MFCTLDVPLGLFCWHLCTSWWTSHLHKSVGIKLHCGRFSFSKVVTAMGTIKVYRMGDLLEAWGTEGCNVQHLSLQWECEARLWMSVGGVQSQVIRRPDDGQHTKEDQEEDQRCVQLSGTQCRAPTVRTRECSYFCPMSSWVTGMVLDANIPAIFNFWCTCYHILLFDFAERWSRLHGQHASVSIASASTRASSVLSSVKRILNFLMPHAAWELLKGSWLPVCCFPVITALFNCLFFSCSGVQSLTLLPVLLLSWLLLAMQLVHMNWSWKLPTIIQVGTDALLCV